MAKKYYLATVSWDLDQNIPAPIPSGFRWKASKNIFLRVDEFPTYGLLLKLALRSGASKAGFRVDAVSEVPDNFRQSWAELEVFEPDLTEM